MSDLQNYYDNVCRSGAWSDPDPNLCGCNGSGWFNSDLDTQHKCRFHRPNAPHPEWSTPEEMEDYWDYDEGFLTIDNEGDWPYPYEAWIPKPRVGIDDDIPF